MTPQHPTETAQTGTQNTEAPTTGTPLTHAEDILGSDWKPSRDDVSLGYCELLRATLGLLRHQAGGMARAGTLEDLRIFARAVGDLADAFHNVGEMMLPHFPWMTDEVFRESHLRPLKDKVGVDYEKQLDFWVKASATVRAVNARRSAKEAA